MRSDQNDLRPLDDGDFYEIWSDLRPGDLRGERGLVTTASFIGPGSPSLEYIYHAARALANLKIDAAEVSVNKSFLGTF